MKDELKIIIKKSQEWLEKAESEKFGCYADLYDQLYSLQIASGICLYNELHFEPIADDPEYQQRVYDLIDEVLADE